MSKSLIIAFGSQVKGNSNSSSDFDFGVLEDIPLTLSRRTDLADYISKKLNINEDKIDLVDLYTVSPILKFEVAKNGKLIEGQDFDFIRFKVRAMKEYQDTAKFRLLRKKIILKNNVT
jgi:predicted nucleotidyltransferase